MKLSRRGLMTAAALTSVATAAPALAQSGLVVRNLQANSLTNPLGLDDATVRLSWQLVSPQRKTMQTRYRVRVASSNEGLAGGQADLWDSGEVESDRCFDVTYAGKPLASRQRVFWDVLVTDNHGNSARSMPATWEMALLQPSDWSAKWIAAEDEGSRADREAGLTWVAGGRAPNQAPRQFRLKFNLAEAAETTLVTIANNSYRLWVDGKAVALPDDSAPRFGKSEVAESTVSLGKGDHVVAIEVKDPDGFLAMYQPENAMAILIRARFKDGRTQRFSSAGTRTALVADAGWMMPAFDDAAWSVAKTADYQMEALPGKGAYLLRKAFSADKPVARARLYASALGGYETWINGQRVGDALLTPESTDFRESVLYQTYDVTKLVKAGVENAIGAIVGDGWYGSYNAPAGRFAYGPPPLRYLAQLEITYTDGSHTTVGTDDSWRITPSPIVMSEIYNGETYDARKEIAGWSEGGLDATSWNAAGLAPLPAGTLKAQDSQPIRQTQTRPSNAITEPKPGVYVFDFGQNFAGWVRLIVRGQAGDTVTLKFAEYLLPSGEVDQANLRAAKCTDTYILKGGDHERWEPCFTYHGFRYVQVEGYPGTPNAKDVVGQVIHSDLPETGHLRIGNPVIQQLWQNTLWSQRSNFVGLPTDCPQRDERLGWMGDAGVFWDAAAFNMNVVAFTRRFMNDVRDAQTKDGAFPDFAPNAWDEAWGEHGASPGWSDAGVILPWTVWWRYGDTSVIDENWDAMTRYMRFLEVNNPDYLWLNKRGHDYADWVALDAKEPGDPTTPKDLVATAMWKMSLDMMTAMAQASGRAAEAAVYRATAEKVRTAYVKAFVRADGTVGNGSHTGYILSLKYNLVPTEQRATTAAHLVAEIKRRGMLLTTGFLGTPSSLDVLADAGYSDIVYNLLLRTEFPSWGYMVAKGATTIWERWNGDVGDVSMNSFNHYALGAVTGFVFRRIAGIDPVEPGFRRFRFAPVLDGRVKTGGGDYDSVLGRISTEWDQGEGGFSLKLTVPANAVAEVVLPGNSVTEGGKSLPREVKVLSRKDGKIALEVGSGEYMFVSK
ncbi:alfa-L-rhamnosidase [Asticcacaulis biprosthecium C19]|uniref:alpha-L-rhamnosidase n=1 Tax=Asticcacaulis biprosthecium C19 TaxID=715226 RepID=F4QSC3_9CAUL|nr:alpha-L-rhamnosidase [Asticcacaulis biprosthecium]EGF89643.1 alfa-L-rhamnosidase [Asticcacaulis biprosthecium C19]